MRLRDYAGSLAGKLVITIFVLMTVGSTVSGVLLYRYQEHVTMRNLSEHASMMDEFVKKSLAYNMLTNRCDAISYQLDALGSAGQIREIRMYGADAEVLFSADKSEIGSRIGDKDAVERALKDLTGSPRLVRPEVGKAIMEYYSPIRNQASCSSAECHMHPPEQKVLGALYTSFDVTALAAASRELLAAALVIGGVLIFTLSVFLYFIITRFVTKPVAVLEQGMRRISESDFSTPIEIKGRDELSRLASNFNAMAEQVQGFQRRLENWANELQREVDLKAAEIMETQEQLANAEKLASLGRLAAGVAHEINNPLTGVITFAHLMLERIPKENALDREDLETILEQANRCTKIIKGLLSFSRKGATERAHVNLNELTEGCVSLVRNQSAFQNISFDFLLMQDLPKITVDANQIQQVLLNLITNAADAMNGSGTITIETRTVAIDTEDYAEMALSDTGPGILPEHMNKILEPFFTTKDIGKGTGLGLPVSYGIVKRHGGDLLLQSKLGKGTTVTVRLPIRQAAGRADSDGSAKSVEFS
jgi:two-component system NtrC family sensor kinase